MDRLISQIPVAERVPILADSVRAARAMKEAYAKEEADWLDQLAQAEAEVGPVSGLIEGQNPYRAPADVAPEGTQGDLVDPTTGESGGGA